MFRIEIKVEAGHLKNKGKLQHTQTKATSKALSDAGRKARALKKLEPVKSLNWGKS